MLTGTTKTYGKSRLNDFPIYSIQDITFSSSLPFMSQLIFAQRRVEYLVVLLELN